MDALLNIVTAACNNHLPPRAGLVIAVSGGPDSQCLLDLLARARDASPIGAVVAVGIDHGLRPEAPKELDFAQQLAQSHHIPFERIPVQIPPRGNLMAQARAVRYEALRAVATRHGARFIATGHTATDQAETVLFNLTRGAGPRGVSGMAPTQSDLFRPLLGVSRAQTLNYVHQNKLPHATDPTNEDTTYSRPLLRHEVLPRLHNVNPHSEKNINHFADLIRQDDLFLTQLAQREFEAATSLLGSLRLASLQKLPGPLLSRVLLLWLERHSVHQDRALLHTLQDLIRRGDPAFKQSVGRGTTLELSGGNLWCHRPHPGYHLTLPCPGDLSIPDLPGALSARPLKGDKMRHMLKKSAFNHPWEVAFGIKQLHPEREGFTVRTWQTGDRIQSFGSTGHTTLGDLFTNARIPRPLRRVWPLVEWGGEIVWVPGLRRGAGLPVTPNSEATARLKWAGGLWPLRDEE